MTDQANIATGSGGREPAAAGGQDNRVVPPGTSIASVVKQAGLTEIN